MTKRITKQFIARDYIRHFSYEGPDYEYKEIKLDDQINKFLEENPNFTLGKITPMGGDLKKVEGAKYIVEFEDSHAN